MEIEAPLEIELDRTATLGQTKERDKILTYKDIVSYVEDFYHRQ